MTRHKESAKEILKNWDGDGPCDIACRLCGTRVTDDAPTAIWQGFKPGLGGGFRIDEHERCDEIAKVMESAGFDTKLNAFLAGFGIAADEDHAAARRVLQWRLGHRWPLGNT